MTAKHVWAVSMFVWACDGSAMDPEADAGSSSGSDSGVRRDSGSTADPDGGSIDTDGGRADAGGVIGDWRPPRGIPMPEFGVNEEVDETCGELTPVAFTSLDALASLPGGSVVEIPPGVHADSRIQIGGTGTACQPIFVRGASVADRPVLRGLVEIRGSYVIVENVSIDLSADENDGVNIDSSDHVALRHSEVHGLDIRRNTTVVFINGSTHVVLLDNHIHDNGDFTAAGEIDVHGVGAGGSWDLWIVDNHIHHNRGDGMQFGHQANNTLGRIYVGRNDIHDNGENSVDIKEASQLVISENRLHDEPLGPVVLHDCPIDAAVLDNEIFGGDYGVSMASLEDACDDAVPVTLFVLRNRFHDTGRGVEAWGTGKRYFVAGNSFESVSSAIEIDPEGAGSRISEDAAALEDGLAAFQAAYGIDIR